MTAVLEDLLHVIALFSRGVHDYDCEGAIHLLHKDEKKEGQR